MHENDKAVLVYTTFPAREVAEQVGAVLVEAKLAACVNIIPGMVAIYTWQGMTHRDDEVVMIIKTRRGCVDEAMAETRRRHPYDTPALLVLPVEGGDGEYLAWITRQTSDTAAKTKDDR